MYLQSRPLALNFFFPISNILNQSRMEFKRFSKLSFPTCASFIFISQLQFPAFWHNGGLSRVGLVLSKDSRTQSRVFKWKCFSYNRKNMCLKTTFSKLKIYNGKKGRPLLKHTMVNWSPIAQTQMIDRENQHFLVQMASRDLATRIAI